MYHNDCVVDALLLYLAVKTENLLTQSTRWKPRWHQSPNPTVWWMEEQGLLWMMMTTFLGMEIWHSHTVRFKQQPNGTSIHVCPLLPLSFSLPTSPTDLSELLAEGTKESHDKAENCQFVKDFLRGRIKKELFKVVTQSVLYFCHLWCWQMSV